MLSLADLIAALDAVVGVSVVWHRGNDDEAVGVHLDLPNGVTLYIQWREGAYSNLAPGYLQRRRGWRMPVTTPTYEAAALCSATGRFIRRPGDHDDVLPYVTVPEIAVFAKWLLDGRPA